ncbi:MAG: CDP-alcohol phosphatidyltransferase family protein [Bacteroidia bacterium]
MKKIPYILLYSRLVMAFINVLLVFILPENAGRIIACLIVLALLTDIFDGISARLLNVSTEKLRRLDSKIDQVFWCSVLFSLFILRTDFFIDHFAGISILVASECACMLYSWIRFRKFPALHAYLAKAWAILITATSVQVLLCPHNSILFKVTFVWGLISQLETIAILAVLPHWHNDVPGIIHALKIRHNKPVKRYKLFNG